MSCSTSRRLSWSRSPIALVALALLLGGTLPRALAQLPSFPGADGAAGEISGGRGGIVYHVTKLDKNYSDTGYGTLRYGLDNSNFAAGTARTIVFDVAGTFWLGRYGEDRGHDNGWDSQSRLNIGSNVTIAGQTAPGPVYIMGGVVKANNTNSIVRNVTIAPCYGLRGFAKPDEGVEPTEGTFPDSYTFDAIDISGQGIMIDHVTTLYATDETISANELADDVTIQYTNISQGQNYPQADAEASGVRYTGHALGSLLQAGSNAQISVFNNLYAQQKGRLPRVGSEVGTGPYNDFRNNVFYNWYDTAGTGGSYTQPSFNNFLGNFYLSGPGGDDVSQLPGDDGTLYTDDDIGIVVSKSGGTGIFSASVYNRVYASGNLKDTNKDGDPNDTATATYSANLRSAAYDLPSGVTLSAPDAFENVLSYMGADWWKRDYDYTLGNTAAIDTPDERLIHETYTGTGKIMAWADDPFDDDPNEGVEWRNMLSYRADTTTGDAPYNHSATWDVDGDGMPGYWEEAHGLDPSVANNNADFDSDGYTDLEEYLNDVAAWPAPGTIEWTGGTTRYAEIGNWQVSGIDVDVLNVGTTTSASYWQPSRYDEVEINSGSVVVDSVGQHAGALRIASSSGDTSSLTVSGGWLKAAESITVGAVAGAQGTLTIAGGHVFTPLLSKGADGTFTFNGGTLTAEVIDFDVSVTGGTLAPAAIGDFDVETEVVTTSGEIGVTHIQGDLDVQSGVVEIDLAGPMSFDELWIDGELSAGGTLSVSLLDSFEPQASDAFDILDFSSAIGSFTLDLPALPQGLSWDSSALMTTGTLSVTQLAGADFDDDGDIDISDLMIWQRGFGLTGQTDNANGDADGNGIVDAGDLDAWKSAFGTSAIVGSVVVPEPGSFCMFLGAVLLWTRRSRRS